MVIILLQPEQTSISGVEGVYSNLFSMLITATIANSAQENNVTVATDGNAKALSIPSKTTGRGSSVNGGELLFLSLAVCFCNDIYREAAKRNMHINSVEVTVHGQFGKEGEPASDIVYKADIKAPEYPQEEINKLIHDVDSIAEIHKTLRQGVAVRLEA